jgi:hypothetical protein
MVSLKLNRRGCIVTDRVIEKGHNRVLLFVLSTSTVVATQRARYSIQYSSTLGAVIAAAANSLLVQYEYSYCILYSILILLRVRSTIQYNKDTFKLVHCTISDTSIPYYSTISLSAQEVASDS